MCIHAMVVNNLLDQRPLMFVHISDPGDHLAML